MINAASRMFLTGTAAPFNPSKLSPGLWYDASYTNLRTTWTGSTVPSVSGDPVGKWGDRSGTGADAIMDYNDARRPLFETSILNGLPVVRFDGSVSVLHIYSNNPSFSGSWTACFVAKKPSSSDNIEILGNTAANVFIEHYSDGKLYFATTGGFATASFSATSFQVISCGFSGTTPMCYVNGVSQTATWNSRPSWTGGIANELGHADGTYGKQDLAEVLFFPTALASADRNAVEKWLGAKWGITVS